MAVKGILQSEKEDKNNTNFSLPILMEYNEDGEHIVALFVTNTCAIILWTAEDSHYEPGELTTDIETPQWEKFNGTIHLRNKNGRGISHLEYASQSQNYSQNFPILMKYKLDDRLESPLIVFFISSHEGIVVRGNTMTTGHSVGEFKRDFSDHWNPRVWEKLADETVELSNA